MSTTKINDGINTVVTSIASPPPSSAVGMVVREAAQGQKTMANSIPVTIASDQSTLPVQISPANGSAAASTAAFTNNFKLFDFQFLGQDNLLLWYQSLTGGATGTFNTTTQALNMNCATASGDQIIRQTQRIMGQSGATMLFIVSCNIGAKKTNVRQRVGAFDTNDGYFFEQDATNLKIVSRTSSSGAPVDTSVNQSSWNIDKLDGTGVSGITLNPAFDNDYFVTINYDFIAYGIIINGIAYYCHSLSFHNNQTNQPTTTRNFPIRLELTNTGAAASSTAILLNACSVFASGGTAPFGITRSIDLGITGKTVGAILTPLVTLRLKSTNARNKLVVQSVSMLLSASQSTYYSLIFNGTLTAPTWNSVPGTNTISEFDTAATLITGGNNIFSSYVSGQGQGNGGLAAISPDITSLLQASANIADTADTITLAAQKTGGTSPTAYASLLFREFV